MGKKSKTLTKIILITISLGLIFFPIQAIQANGQETDSLKKLDFSTINNSNNPNDLVAFFKIALARTKSDSLSSLYQQISELAEERNQLAALSQIEWLLGKHYRTEQQHKKALPHLERALSLTEQHSNDTLKINVLDELTAAYYWLHIAEKAMQSAAAGLELAEKVGDVADRRAFLQWFGRVFEIQAQWTEALEYYQKVLDISLPSENPDWLFNAYLNLACTYYKKWELEKGLSYLEYCKKYAKLVKNSREQMAVTWLWEGLMKDGLRSHKEAIQLFRRIIPIFDSLDIPNRQMHSRLALGQVYINTQRYDEAIEMAQQVLSFDPERVTIYETRYAYQQLYIAHKLMGRYNEALANLELLNKEETYLDSLNNAQIINELEAKYQDKEQKQTIAQQDELLKLQKKTQTYFLMALVFLIGLLAGTFFAIVYLNRTRNRLASQNTIIDQQKKDLQRLDKIKDDFFANISHELRTPLTVILGVSQLKKSYQYSSQIIQRNAKRLLQLVNELLDLSKLDAGNLKVNYQQIDLIAFIQYMVKPFHVLAEQKNISLEVQHEKEQLSFVTDTEKLQQVINNLLSNAIKFTPENGEVEVKITEQEKQIELMVSDTGMGIPEEALSNIFDRFYQVNKPANAPSKGTGIGLSLVKELVQLMKGNIRVESKVGKGTQFIIHLPILGMENAPKKEVVLPSPTLALTRNPEPAVAYENSEDQPIVLIIEDDPDIVIYLQALLQPHYQVQTAENGEIGIEKAIEQIPDIIICDVQMPKKDGFEVVEILKTDERTNHVPIIMLTARAAQQDKLIGLKHGADAYLTKPFDQEELFIRLEKLLELRRVLQERYAASPATSEEKAPPPEPEFIQKIRAILESDIQAILTVEELSEKMFLTRVQVYRKTKALIGLTPSQLMNRIRLEHGAKMLRSTSLSISEIAYDIGYTDPKYFSRLFAKEYGQSPSAYRTNRGESS